MIPFCWGWRSLDDGQAGMTGKALMTGRAIMTGKATAYTGPRGLGFPGLRTDSIGWIASQEVARTPAADQRARLDFDQTTGR